MSPFITLLQLPPASLLLDFGGLLLRWRGRRRQLQGWSPYCGYSCLFNIPVGNQKHLGLEATLFALSHPNRLVFSFGLNSTVKKKLTIFWNSPFNFRNKNFQKVIPCVELNNCLSWIPIDRLWTSRGRSISFYLHLLALAWQRTMFMEQ